jgi:RNA polymerase sigma factor (sigma-70 family)
MLEPTDQELVERGRRGDGTAIGELFSRYWRAARAAAFGVTGEFAAAEDAAAEGFRQALAGIDNLRDPSRFGPWLRTIVIRKARLGLRSSHAVADTLPEAVSDSKERPDDALERLELQLLIQQAVRELPDRLREAVSIFYIEGYDSDAAAQFLDIPPGTFRRRLHEGRQRLRSAAKQILHGSKSMNHEREREIERLRSLIDRADGSDQEPLFEALRGILALRPPAHELIGPWIQRQMESEKTSAAPPNGKDFKELARFAAERFGAPSKRASDPNDPVGVVAAAIRKALPHFQDWQLDLADAAERFLTFTGDHRTRLQAVLPPGFAQGREGAFVRATHAFLVMNENGSARTTYQVLRDSADPQDFREGMSMTRISDVLDLTWMVAGSIELRSVQDLLEQLTAAILPGTVTRFAQYEEPRYRSALQLQIGAVDAPAAIGGVLTEWPGRPHGVDSAHLRIFLEPWATVHSGQVVEFNQR